MSIYFHEKNDKELEEEIEVFLFKIYDIVGNDGIVLGKRNDNKRIKLSHSIKDKRISLERTRRLITYLCNIGKYEFLYNTFKSNYLDIWTNNLQTINRHKLLKLIESRKKRDIYLEDFLLEILFDEIIFGSESEKETLYDYMSNFAKLWCHHKRSTEIVCNVYLYFDCMYKRFKRSMFKDSEEDYTSFIQNANFYLKKLIMRMRDNENSDIIMEETDFKDNEKLRVDNTPVCLTSVLFSIFYVLNDIRNNYFNNKVDSIEMINEDQKKNFFIIKKLFEMLIQLKIVDRELMELYIRVMNHYHSRIVDNRKKIYSLKEYSMFIRRVLEFEKQLLLNQNNRKIIQNNGFYHSYLNFSLLSFMKQDNKLTFNEYCINNDMFDPGINYCTDSYEKINWNDFVYYVELKILDVLIPNDLITYYSNKGNCNCLSQLVLDKDFEVLKFLFNLFEKKNKELFRKEFENCIIELGLILCKKLICYKSMNDNKNYSNYNLYLNNIQELLDLYINIEKIWKISFSEDEQMRNLCINESWIQILNFNEDISKEIMRGFSLFLHKLFFIYDVKDDKEFDYLNKICYKRISRVNVEIINWNIDHLISNFIQEIEKPCDQSINENKSLIDGSFRIDDYNLRLISIRKYIEAIIYLFKCSNFKEYFQQYYHNLLSQRLIFKYIPNKIGFGGNIKNMSDYYFNWISNSINNNIDMLSNKFNVFEMYLLKLIYNECGYTFINKFNFIIKDWFTSLSIFKFYLQKSISDDKTNQYLEFLDLDKRIKIFHQSSFLYDNIQSWLKSEDLNTYNDVSSVNATNNSASILSEIESKQEKEEIETETTLKRIIYQIPFSIIILSSTNWPLVNNNNNFINCELFIKYKNNKDINLIYNEMSLYQKFYKKIYSRTLNWSYSLGICILEFNVKKDCQKIDLILTLQQAILLLCFNDNDRISLSYKEFSLLKDNFCALFRNNIIFVKDKNTNEIDQINVPSILNLLNKQICGNINDDMIIIELNDEFFEYMEKNPSFFNFIESKQFLINYASSYNDEKNNVELYKDYYLDSTFNEDGNLKENEYKNEINNKVECSNLEYENNKSNFASLFKNNKYRIEAIIMKYLKHKHRSTLSNIVELIITELSLKSLNTFQDSKMISEEILKCLNSLIQRDLIEVDPRDDQYYNYVP